MAEEFAGLGSSIYIGLPGQPFEEMNEVKISKTVPSLIPSVEEPYEWKDERIELRGRPRPGFFASFTCDLPGSAEAEAIRDMMSRDMPEMEFDVQILPSLYKKCYGRAPRKILKAMIHGGYYKRNTKWKRKAIALSNRDLKPSPFTIERAKIETDDDGRVCIVGGIRGGRKSNKRIND